MSEFNVQVVKLGAIEKHSNADAFGVTKVLGGYPVIVRLGEFREGDLAVYVPIDSLVPADDPRWAFLAGHLRIKARRLRGVFSMGLLTAADPSWVEGQNVQEEFRIVKWEPPIDLRMGGENAKDPGFLPIYTDIEGLRRFPNVLVPGERVILTEKLHGCNARFLWHQDRLWVGSHRNIKKDTSESLWWRVARQERLAERLQPCPGIAIYGEVFGQVQGLRYDTARGELRLALFDAMDVATRRYLDYGAFQKLAEALGLPTVPLLYAGPWDLKLREYANGKSTLANHCREGFVVRPVVERWHAECGRVILKLIGEEYMLRKET